VNIILLGPPGAGKGTQSHLLVDRLNFSQIATGDILREEIERDSSLGKKVSSIIDAGELVDDNTMVELIDSSIDAHLALGVKKFIFDGFPRTIKQAVIFDELLQRKSMSLDAVIKLEVDDDILVKRVCGRFTCSSCGEGFHDTLKIPKVVNVCDKCGGTKFKRRNDDTESTVRSRLASYHKLTDPLTDYYHEKGKLFRVDGMLSISEISHNLIKITQQYAE
jgi:adenylate kinase